MTLYVGIFAFIMAVAALIFTVWLFRKLPKKQKPEFDDVAAQAQPTRLSKKNVGTGK